VQDRVILLDPDHPAHLSGDEWQPVTFGPERHRAYAFPVDHHRRGRLHHLADPYHQELSPIMNRTTIIAVFAVFFLPVIIAVLIHSEWFQWRPAQTRNHGELLQPPHALPDFRLQDADGRVI
jgi:hypothetical protein